MEIAGLALPIWLILTVGASSFLALVWLLLQPETETAQKQGLRVDARTGRTNAVPMPRASDAKSWSQQDEQRRKLGDRLVQAGLYKRGSTTFFYMTQVALAGVPLTLGILGATVGMLPLQTALLLGLTCGIGGIVLPGLWLDLQKRKRQTMLRRALPDALDLLNICIGSGLSMPSALVRITRELRTAHPMLATELIIVHREIQLGYSTGEAFRRMADRFDLNEVRSLASVISQAERFGASIITAIRVHAETLRHRRMEEAREKAQKATVKILFPTMLGIFPAMFVVILGPATFTIVEVFKNLSIPTP